MGGDPYWYFVEYNSDIKQALNELRNREFKAGRYNPATWFPEFPIDFSKPEIGAKHASIDDAIMEAEADGTRSILDISEISDESDDGVATPLSTEMLNQFFGTTKPTRENVESNYDYFHIIQRGQCIYIIVYKNDEPDEILFAGYSYD